MFPLPRSVPEPMLLFSPVYAVPSVGVQSTALPALATTRRLSPFPAVYDTATLVSASVPNATLVACDGSPISV